MKGIFITLFIISIFSNSIKSDPIVPIIKNLLNNENQKVNKSKSEKKKKDNSAPSKNLFGKYGSSYEAYSACRSWAYNKKYYYKKNGYFKCRRDLATSQVIGMKDFKVKNRFKY